MLYCNVLFSYTLYNDSLVSSMTTLPSHNLDRHPPPVTHLSFEDTLAIVVVLYQFNIVQLLQYLTRNTVSVKELPHHRGIPYCN